MRAIGESDIYVTNPKTKESIDTKIAMTLGNKAEGTVILNRRLNQQMTVLRATFKETIVRKVCDAVDNGEIILYYTSPNYNLPTCMPFYKYNKGGKVKVNVNLTNYLTITKNVETGADMYSIDTKKLYSLLVSAYLYLKAFDKRASLPTQAIEISATIWAKMFCKVMANEVGLATNRERYEAFMYYAVRFFCAYYLECPPVVVDNISLTILKKRTAKEANPIAGEDARGPMIHYIETQLAERGININESLHTFLNTMFNYEITGIRHSRISEKGKSLSITYFIQKWIRTYDYSSLFALGAYPYFIFVVLSAYSNAFIVNDRVLEDILSKNNPREVPTLMNSLYSMIQ